jgi:hypothetical protein
LTVLLPFLAAPWLTRGLNRESNAVNLAMLLGLTAIASLAAWQLCGLNTETGEGTALLLLTMVLALGYNVWLLSKLEELRT